MNCSIVLKLTLWSDMGIIVIIIDMIRVRKNVQILVKPVNYFVLLAYSYCCYTHFVSRHLKAMTDKVSSN